jgi:hypothetical protein
MNTRLNKFENLRKPANSNKLGGTRPGMVTLTRGVILIVIVLAGTHLLSAQHTFVNPSAAPEQSQFSVELVPIQRPVRLSSAALNALGGDQRVASCLEEAGLRRDQLPPDWFIASGIHLDGSAERDLIVMPGGPLDGPPRNECLVGANTAQFWVLRKTRKGFALVLSQMAHNLDVLHTRTNGLRDINMAAVVGAGYYARLEYRFDGRSYQIAARSSALIGAEIPHDLSGYETRQLLVQLPGQPAEPLRAEARAWIWQRWKGHTTSYLRVRTIGESGSDARRQCRHQQASSIRHLLQPFRVSSPFHLDL